MVRFMTVLLGCVLVLGGCGGGGDTTSTPASVNQMSTAILNGTYVVNQYMDDEVGISPGGYSLTNRMEITFDGAGNASFIGLASSTGTSPGGSFTYAVAADGTVTFSTGDVGIVSADGNALTWTDTDASDNAVAIFVSIKKGTGLSNATLNGTYVFGLCGDDQVGTPGGASLATLKQVVFDGLGNFTWVDLARSAGSLSSGSGSYSVTSDGTITTDMGETGIVASDGSFFSISDTDPSNNYIDIGVGFKKGAGLSNATLDGTYVVNTFMDEAVGLTQGGSSIALRMELNFDGAGNFTYMEVAHSSGNPSSGSGTYSVASDGSLSFSLGGEGIVSADGNSLTWVDTDATDNIISFSTGTKKSSPQAQAFTITNFSEGDTLPNLTPVFTWSAKSGADSYLVRVSKDNASGNCQATSSCQGVWEISPVTMTSIVFNSDGFAVESLVPGTTYSVNIIAYSSGTQIDQTNDVKFKVSN